MSCCLLDVQIVKVDGVRPFDSVLPREVQDFVAQGTGLVSEF